MNLGEILDKVYNQLGKDQYGGYITPRNYNEAIKWINLEQINDLLKVFEEKREITDDLLPFVKTIGDSTSVPLQLDSFGYMDIPEDYYYYVRSSYTQYVNECDGAIEKVRPIEFLNQADFGYRLGTDILAPSLERPIAVIQNNKWLVRPIGVNNIIFSYLRRPVDPVFDYDIVNSEIFYLPPGTVHQNSSVLPAGTPSESVEFEWPESVHYNLVELIVKYFTINIQSAFNLQTLDINKGQ
jgi:hypothetical protein